MGLNKVLISGRLPRDPEPIGQVGVKFTIGVNGYNFSTKSRETTWVPCVAFGKVADRVKSQLSAKREVIVEGRYQVREYESPPGTKRKDTAVNVDNFEFVGPPPDGQFGPQTGRQPDAQPENDENQYGW